MRQFKKGFSTTVSANMVRQVTLRLFSSLQSFKCDLFFPDSEFGRSDINPTKTEGRSAVSSIPGLASIALPDNPVDITYFLLNSECE